MAAEPLSFTRARIDALPIPATGDHWYYDDHKDYTRKLRLRVSATGARNWYFYSKIGGKPKRLSIGAFADISVADARKTAARLGGEIAAGRDPQAEKQKRRIESTRKQKTLADALDQLLQNKTHKHSQATVKGYQATFRSREAGLHKWMTKPLVGISESMVEKWFRGRLAKAEAAAALEGRYLRAVINTAMSEWGTPEKNPCDVLSRKDLWPDIAPRVGIVTEQQMPAFFAALQDLPRLSTNTRARYHDARDYLQFLLFSGCRVEETSLLKPDDIDIEGRGFILRDPKNRQKNTRLPLNDQLLAIVQRRLDLQHEYLFADDTGVRPMKTPRKAIAENLQWCSTIS